MALSKDTRRELVRMVERASAWPLLVLSIAMIPILIGSIVAPRHMGLREADWLIWSIFAFEYVLRIVISPDRGSFVREHPIDLLVVGLPFLEPLRFLRAVRAARALAFFGEALHEETVAEGTKRSRWQRQRPTLAFLDAGATVIRRQWQLAKAKLPFSGFAATRKQGAQKLILWVVVGALIAMPIFAWHYESKSSLPNASPIHTMGDAYWWAISTLSTVGYGDRVPVTPEGRGIGYVFMLLGIAVFVAVTGIWATWLLGRDTEQHPIGASQGLDADRKLGDELSLIAERLARIEAAVIPPGEP